MQAASVPVRFREQCHGSCRRQEHCTASMVLCIIWWFGGGVAREAAIGKAGFQVWLWPLGCTSVPLVPEVRPRVTPCLHISVWMVLE